MLKLGLLLALIGIIVVFVGKIVLYQKNYQSSDFNANTGQLQDEINASNTQPNVDFKSLPKTDE